MLRFQGYYASKEMFERSTGMDAKTALECGEEVIASLRDAVSSAGFKPAGEFFKRDEPRGSTGLDAFTESVGPAAAVGLTPRARSALPA